MTSLKESVKEYVLRVRYDPFSQALSGWADGYISVLEEHMKEHGTLFWNDATTSQYWREGYYFAVQKMLKFLKGEGVK